MPTAKQLTKASQEALHERVVTYSGTTIEALRQPLIGVLTPLADVIAQWNTHQGFWVSENTGEKIALMHSELSEALEADRKDLPSDKIDGFSGIEEEFADCMIRIMDYAGKHGLRLGEAIAAKLQHNLQRPFMHGKGY